MTPSQCKHARHLLGWSRIRLAAKIGLEYHAVSVFENTGRMPPSSTGESPNDRVVAIRATLEAAGVEFISGDLPGVRLKRATL